MRTTAAALAFVLGLLLAQSAGGSTANEVPVTIVARAYQPAQLTIEDGQTVVWTNRGFGAHTVTALGGEFDSGRLNLGESFKFTFTTPGVFAYKCTVHPSMRGSVTVLAPGHRVGPPLGSLRVHLTKSAGKAFVHVQVPAPNATVLLQSGPPWHTIRRGHLSAQGKATLAVAKPRHRLRVVVQAAGGPPLVGKPLSP
ncbi:MAG TPA: cupredoxin domain-containing protein [Solirubrobacteraceae bacterium]|nr:cupredoxin domain-containing protein [Solirubrobacteraceae bacterium]